MLLLGSYYLSGSLILNANKQLLINMREDASKVAESKKGRPTPLTRGYLTFPHIKRKNEQSGRTPKEFL